MESGAKNIMILRACGMYRLEELSRAANRDGYRATTVSMQYVILLNLGVENREVTILPATTPVCLASSFVFIWFRCRGGIILKYIHINSADILSG